MLTNGLMSSAVDLMLFGCFLCFSLLGGDFVFCVEERSRCQRFSMSYSSLASMGC